MPAAQTWIILLLWSTEPNDLPAWTETSGSEMPLKLSMGHANCPMEVSWTVGASTAQMRDNTYYGGAPWLTLWPR